MDVSKLQFLASQDLFVAPKVTTYHKFAVMDQIEGQLDEVSNFLFATGIFKTILSMTSQLNYSHVIVHYALMRAVKTQKKFEMWFNMQGNVLSFSLQDFAAITGLKCTDFEGHVIPDQVFECTLGTKNKITLDDIIAEFAISSGERKMVLAHLIIVEGVLMPQRKDSAVRLKFLKLASNYQAFLNYPWGREVYLETLRAFQDASAHAKRTGGGSSNDRVWYTLYGYPLAFQVWVLEHFHQFCEFVGAATASLKTISYGERWFSLDNNKLAWYHSVSDHFDAHPLLCRPSPYEEHSTFCHLNFLDEVEDPLFDAFAEQVFVTARQNSEQAVSNTVISERPAKTAKKVATKPVKPAPKRNVRKPVQKVSIVVKKVKEPVQKVAKVVTKEKKPVQKVAKVFKVFNKEKEDVNKDKEPVNEEKEVVSTSVQNAAEMGKGDCKDKQAVNNLISNVSKVAKAVSKRNQPVSTPDSPLDVRTYKRRLSLQDRKVVFEQSPRKSPRLNKSESNQHGKPEVSVGACYAPAYNSCKRPSKSPEKVGDVKDSAGVSVVASKKYPSRATRSAYKVEDDQHAANLDVVNKKRKSPPSPCPKVIFKLSGSEPELKKAKQDSVRDVVVYEFVQVHVDNILRKLWSDIPELAAQDAALIVQFPSSSESGKQSSVKQQSSSIHVPMETNAAGPAFDSADSERTASVRPSVDIVGNVAAAGGGQFDVLSQKIEFLCNAMSEVQSSTKEHGLSLVDVAKKLHDLSSLIQRNVKASFQDKSTQYESEDFVDVSTHENVDSFATSSEIDGTKCSEKVEKTPERKGDLGEAEVDEIPSIADAGGSGVEGREDIADTPPNAKDVDNIQVDNIKVDNIQVDNIQEDIVDIPPKGKDVDSRAFGQHVDSKAFAPGVDSKVLGPGVDSLTVGKDYDSLKVVQDADKITLVPEVDSFQVPQGIDNADVGGSSQFLDDSGCIDQYLCCNPDFLEKDSVLISSGISLTQDSLDTLPASQNLIDSEEQVNKYPKKALDVGTQVRKSSRLPTPSALVQSPFTEEKKKKISMPSCPPYSFYGDDDRRKFFEWFYLTGKKEVIKRKEHDFDFTKHFFNKLLLKSTKSIGQAKWLNDCHISEALFYFRKHINENSEEFKEVAIMDWIWYCHFNADKRALIAKDDEAELLFFQKYFIGMYPKHEGRCWSESVTRVYTPFNFQNEHWVALEIDLANWHVTVYDSSIQISSDAYCWSKISTLCCMLPVVMKKSHLFGHINYLDKDFSWSRRKDVPQDGMIGNCGLYCIKFIEHLAIGTSWDDLDDEHMRAHREKMIIDLFNEKWEFKALPLEKDRPKA